MEKKPETQKDNEGEGSNSHEVFRTYLMTIVATLLIIILSIVTYYYPMYFTSQKALDIIRKQKLPILANVLILSNLSSRSLMLKTMANIYNLRPIWMEVIFFGISYGCQPHAGLSFIVLLNPSVSTVLNSIKSACIRI